ncbi:deaminase [Microbacterium sp. Leaf288]|uniref:dihydrofolate reductase family protein n=1 Tax=Microbacterium TaxID=33882 RepID=UPI0006FD61B6|nr:MULTISPECIES: dihydrofolate reductase family protein [Microbacterium]KQP70108.1 deaminase [Microbacterium sp. Leaf288]MDR7113480.1 dihydrofolate reductase [Microbacterium trichothecenolyticum]
MTRVRVDLFSSLDGYTAAPDPEADNPMGEDWGPLTAAYAATRTFRQKVFGDTSGAGTTGIDESFAASFFTGVGAEIMGAAMFGLHAYPDDPDWKGWWGDQPPFGYPVYVLTHSAPRPSIPMAGGTTFEFRAGAIEDVLAEATTAAGGLDVRVGGGIRTAREFLREGLVDDLHVAIAPIVLGRGVRVWDDLRGLESTHRVRTLVAESGTIHVTFTREDTAR